jgi:GDPmannose 4,6-dehydratase
VLLLLWCGVHRWEGEGTNEVGINSGTGAVVVRVDPRYFRPTEVDYLQGNPTKAMKELGWKPEVSFEELVKEMVKADLELAKEGKDNV